MARNVRKEVIDGTAKSIKNYGLFNFSIVFVMLAFNFVELSITISEMSKLLDILNKEGIAQAELSRASFINVATINQICQGTKTGKVRQITWAKLLKGLQKLAPAGNYKLDDIVDVKEIDA